MTDVLEKARATIAAHDLAAPDAAVLLMVSGGSDSTALAYLGAALREAGDVGPVAMLHVNHQLRGEDADADERDRGPERDHADGASGERRAYRRGPDGEERHRSYHAGEGDRRARAGRGHLHGGLGEQEHPCGG